MCVGVWWLGEGQGPQGAHRQQNSYSPILWRICCVCLNHGCETPCYMSTYQLGIHGPQCQDVGLGWEAPSARFIVLKYLR